MTTAAAAPDYRIIPTLSIDAPVLPSRTEMDEERMSALVSSMQRDGFVSVIGVIPVGDRFEVVYGHRRRMAAEIAGIAAIPCFVYAPERAAAIRLQFGENYLRENVSPSDEAILFEELIEAEPAIGTDGLAARLGLTRDYVEGRLLLRRGCPDVFAALAAKQIRVGVAMELNVCTERPHRLMLLHHAIGNGATVGTVRQWVYQWKTAYRPAEAGEVVSAPATTSGAHVVNEYLRCRICGEYDEPGARDLLNVHSYCVRPLLDPSTGLFRARTDYVLFPRTPDEALALCKRIVDRFPELAATDGARA